MSSASAILTALSDLTNNPKLEHYDPNICKDIHIKLDKEAREQGLSYQERFDMVRTKTNYCSLTKSSFKSISRPERTCQCTTNGLRYFLMVSPNV